MHDGTLLREHLRGGGIAEEEVRHASQLRKLRSSIWRMPVLYGERSLEAVVAMSQQPAGVRLSEIAGALAVSLSSAQRAVEALAGDHLVTSAAQEGRRRAIDRGHPASASLTEFALRRLPMRRALDVVCRANAAVEFAGRDDQGYVVVLSPFAEPADVARLEATFEVIGRERPERIAIEIFERSDLRRRLLDDPELHERGCRMAVVRGSAIRMFRDPDRHGSFKARRLGRLHPSLPRVSERSLAHLAEEHGLARITAFGSAVRADLRPDSDVDILVEPKPGIQLRISDLLRIQERLEGSFGRDVDLVTRGSLEGSVRERVLRDEVVLYERA